MNKKRDFFDKILVNFDKVSSEEKKGLFSNLCNNYNYLNLIFENLEEGIVALDNKSIITAINKKASFLFSIPNDSIGKYLEESFIDKDLLKSVAQAYKNNTGDSVLIQDKNNSRILKTTVLPIGEKGFIKGYIIKGLDITDVYKREQRLKRAEQLASLTTLAAGVAHEIKNPLASISIYIQLLEKSMSSLLSKFDSIEGKVKEDISEYFSILKEEINRLEDTINSFLFSVKTIDLNLSKVNIKDLILNTIDFLKFEIEQEGIDIEVSFEDDNLIINIDERYIKQALINIIQNSIDALKNCNKKKIAINVKSNNKDVIISISDNGIGVNEELKNKIFEPYYTTKSNGTGLGLTNVERIITAHNGTVNIESEKGKGFSFIISIPIISTGQKLLEIG